MTDKSEKSSFGLTSLFNFAWWCVFVIIGVFIVNIAINKGYIVTNPHPVMEDKPLCLNLNHKNGIMWVAHEGEPYMLVSMIDVKNLPVREETKK